MKKFENYIILLTSFTLFCCKTESNINYKIQSELKKNYNSEICIINNEFNSKIQLDSIIILSIDTLTEETLLKYRFNVKTVHIAKNQFMLDENLKIASFNNINSLIKLKMQLPIDTTTIHLNKHEKDSILTDINMSIKYQDSLKKVSNEKTLDNKKVVAYMIMLRVVCKNKRQDSFEWYSFMSPNLKVIEF